MAEVEPSMMGNNDERTMMCMTMSWAKSMSPFMIMVTIVTLCNRLFFISTIPNVYKMYKKKISAS